MSQAISPYDSDFERSKAVSLDHRRAEPAKLVLKCLRCGWERNYKPGSIVAATGVMRSLEFDSVD
jgi:hypothetical protein